MLREKSRQRVRRRLAQVIDEDGVVGREDALRAVLTEDRRREMVKQVRKRAEEARVEVRHRRREAADQLKKALRDGEISEDEEHRELDALQRVHDRFIDAIDGRSQHKEAEVMEV